MGTHINAFLMKIFPAEHQWKMTLLHNWDSIIGPLKDKVRIEKIHGKILVLGVSHPSWAQELTFVAPMLKRKINKLFDEPRIDVIQFHTVSLQAKKEPYKIAKKEAPAVSPPVYVDNAGKKGLAHIENEELKHILSDYYLRIMRLKKGYVS